MALQLTGAFKDDSAVESAGAAAGGRHRRRPDRHRYRDRAAGLLPAAGREDARPLRSSSSREDRRGRGPRRRSTPRSRRFSTSSSQHGRAVRAERARAAAAGEAPDFITLVRRWGGVTLAYRKRMQDSPAYRLNHEEVSKALEEGIAFAENLDPVEAVPDEFGHVTRAWCSCAKAADGSSGRVELPARTVLVAAGTVAQHHLREGTSRHVPARRPPAVLPGLPRGAKTDAGMFTLEPDANGFFTVVQRRRAASSATTATTTRATPATSSRRWRRPRTATRTSCGSSRTRSRRSIPTAQPERERDAGRRSIARLDDQLLARVERVVRLTPTIVEVIVRAPAAARHFHPGQFYRLQNFERLSPHVETDDHRRR